MEKLTEEIPSTEISTKRDNESVFRITKTEASTRSPQIIQKNTEAGNKNEASPAKITIPGPSINIRKLRAFRIRVNSSDKKYGSATLLLKWQ